MKFLKKIGVNSKKAFKNLSNINHEKIKSVLENYNSNILKNKNRLIRENLKDIKDVKRKHLVDRLILNDARIDAIRNSINQISKFRNPVGKVLHKWRRRNGLNIKKITTSIGVIGVIYESRPNVTADAASLCLKSGNCAILRGGSEAYNSNKLLADLFRESLAANKVDKNCVQFIEKKDRRVVDLMLSKMSQFIDVIVPRGGKGLVKRVQQFSNVPIIGHLEGVCHIYINKSSSVKMATKIVLNAKMRRTSICGAAETILIDEKILKSHAIPIIKELNNSDCKVVADKKINKLFGNKLTFAKEVDWRTEYLDAKISIKTVKNVQEAIAHIIKYGTMHTDCIVTKDSKIAKIFLNGVNSSIAMHNVSTQFADGGEFGFGGEIGISTNKLPPRGPVGIDQLTSYKYIVSGKGVIRS